ESSRRSAISGILNSRLNFDQYESNNRRHTLASARIVVFGRIDGISLLSTSVEPSAVPQPLRKGWKTSLHFRNSKRFLDSARNDRVKTGSKVDRDLPAPFYLSAATPPRFNIEQGTARST